MRKLFIILAVVEIIAITVILNTCERDVYVTPLFYTLTCSLILLLLILAITYFAEYTILKKIHTNIKYYGFIYEKNGSEYLIFKDMKNHRAFYNKEIDYINPNLIESLIIQEQTIIPMSNYLQFESEDFKLRVPKDCTNIPEFIVNYVNSITSPLNTYILDEYSGDWVRVINIDDPQDTMTFRQKQ